MPSRPKKAQRQQVESGGSVEGSGYNMGAKTHTFALCRIESGTRATNPPHVAGPQWEARIFTVGARPTVKMPKAQSQKVIAG